jgi:hypothetical protein
MTLEDCGATRGKRFRMAPARLDYPSYDGREVFGPSHHVESLSEDRELLVPSAHFLPRAVVSALATASPYGIA